MLWRAGTFFLSPAGPISAPESMNPSETIPGVAPTDEKPSCASILIKTAVTHSVTYFIVGFLAYTMLDYPRLYAETGLRFIMRPTTDPLVMAGPLFQPLRGLLFGLAFVILRRSFFGRGRGWLRMWAALVLLGILGTFGPSPASIEGMIYTTLPLNLHLIGLPEILLQSLLLSIIVIRWVAKPETIWLRRTMWTLFGLGLLLPALGLLLEGRS